MSPGSAARCAFPHAGRRGVDRRDRAVDAAGAVKASDSRLLPTPGGTPAKSKRADSLEAVAESPVRNVVPRFGGTRPAPAALVFLLELPEPLHIRRLQPTESLSPDIDRLLGDPCFLATSATGILSASRRIFTIWSSLNRLLRIGSSLGCGSHPLTFQLVRKSESYRDCRRAHSERGWSPWDDQRGTHLR